MPQLWTATRDAATPISANTNSSGTDVSGTVSAAAVCSKRGEDPSLGIRSLGPAYRDTYCSSITARVIPAAGNFLDLLVAREVHRHARSYAVNPNLRYISGIWEWVG